MSKKRARTMLGQEFNRVSYQPAGWREGYFTNLYHHDLRYGYAPATTQETRGTVILTHGYGEFIDLYYLAVMEYQKMGFDVWAMDFYGFGKSGRDNPEKPQNPSTKGMLRHVRDLDFFIQNIVRRDPEKPLLMSTHSMGGHIGLLYLQRHPDVFDGAVMSAPMFDIYRMGLPLAFRPLVRAIFNVASLIGFKDDPVPPTPAIIGKVSRVTEALSGENANGWRAIFNQTMRTHTPDAAVERPTFGWVAKAFNTIVKSARPAEMAKVKILVLIGSAGIESLVDNSAHEKATRHMPDATLVRLPTAMHGLWFQDDQNYGLWMKNVRAFMGRVTLNHEIAHDKKSRIDEPATGGTAHRVIDPDKIRAAFPTAQDPPVHP